MKGQYNDYDLPTVFVSPRFLFLINKYVICRLGGPYSEKL